MEETGAARAWEAGSQMDWRGELLSDEGVVGAPSPLLAGRTLFATGTGAFLALGRILHRDPGRPVRLHVPSFFCMDVVRNLKKTFEIRWYRDLPTEPGPAFETLRVEAGDAVLAANTFGVRDGACWREWTARHDGVLLIEDHSHDPFSPWAMNSRADYIVASLRKTLPLPDGAHLWSPKGLETPAPAPEEAGGAGAKLAGMVLKNAYLEGAPFKKDVFRRLEIESEAALARDEGGAASPLTKSALGLLPIDALRARRAANVRTFLERRRARATPDFRPLFDAWPEGAAPFGAILLCPDPAAREALRQRLIGRNVFPAIHWAQALGDDVQSGDERAIDLAARLLTLPADHRYDASDMTRMVERAVGSAV